MGSVRIVIADDAPLIRHGMCHLLDGESDIEVVGEAVSGRHAVQLARTLRPGVLLMDVSMPGMDGLEATRIICSESGLEDVRVLMLSVHADDETVLAALRAGASGFVLKDATTDKIVEAVRTVACGDSILSPAITRKLIVEFAKRPTVNRAGGADELSSLTRRERDVFRMLACGYRNDEIARLLVIGESTVKSHVQRLYEKLGVRDRVQVVIFAYEHGMVEPSDSPLLRAD